MKTGIKSAMAGACALAVAGTLLAVGGGVANAAQVSPFDPPNGSNGSTQGTLSLYDASGNKITGGALNAPPSYVMADTDTGRAGDTLATLYAATPQKGVNPALWPSLGISVTAAYPTSLASVPANLQNKPTALARSIFSWFDAAGYPADFPNSNTDVAWQNLYQIRMLTSGPGQAVDPNRYASATIQVSGNAWTQVYPEPVATSTTTTLAVTPSSPQDVGTPIDLTATVNPAGAAGSVEFFDGASSLGSANVAGGSATKTGVNLPVGSHVLSATFTPTNAAQFAASTSAPLNFQINQAAAANTTTSLSVIAATGPAYANVALHSNVARVSNGTTLGAGTGSVKFFDGPIQIGSAPLTASGADLAYSNFGPGAHSLTAQFVPSNLQNFNGSTSAAVDANYDAPACTTCVDPQTVVVDVPAGGLSISTPYGPGNPFSLGTMTLDSNGIAFSASKQFPKAGDSPLTITDTRAGDLPWTAYITSTDFTNGGSGVIDATGLSYTNVVPSYISGNALNATTKPVLGVSVPSVKGGHQFASAAHGSGSVWIDGLLGLSAPSSTPVGLYTATVTFTIS